MADPQPPQQSEDAMPKTIKHSYTPEGADDPIELEVPVPDGTILPDERDDWMPKSGFKSELARRVDSIIGNKLEDEDFLGTAVERAREKGILEGSDSGDDDDAESFADRLRAGREEWETKALTPVKEELSAAEERIEKLLNSRLEAEILQASGPAKEAFRSRTKGASPLIVKMVNDLFEYDPETDDFYLSDGEGGFEFSSNPGDGSPYKTVDEFMEEFFADPANKDLLDDRRQKDGLDLGRTRTNQSGDHVISREDAKDVRKYRAAKKAAREAGKTLAIADS